jgi:hypothetical protein
MSLCSLKRRNVTVAMIAAFAASLALTALAVPLEARADDGRG